MSKSLKTLGKISRILKIYKKFPDSSDLPAKAKALPGQGSSHRRIVEQLESFDTGVEVLDANFPIMEGSARIDFIASNQAGELILVWVIESLKPERIFQLLPQYDWSEKNLSLWEHLFPQIKKGEATKIKIWLFTQEIDPKLKSILNYLNGISLKIFHYASENDEAPLQIRTFHEVKGVSVSETPIAMPSQPTRVVIQEAPKPPPLKKVGATMRRPTITHEEIHDLMGESWETEMDDEDEITDPFFSLAESNGE